MINSYVYVQFSLRVWNRMERSKLQIEIRNLSVYRWHWKPWDRIRFPKCPRKERTQGLNPEILQHLEVREIKKNQQRSLRWGSEEEKKQRMWCPGTKKRKYFKEREQMKYHKVFKPCTWRIFHYVGNCSKLMLNQNSKIKRFILSIISNLRNTYMFLNWKEIY